MQQAFTPDRVNAMEPHTREITRKLIDNILAHGSECEFLHQFTLPLPSTVMSGLLGVDASMMETFSRWASSMMGGNSSLSVVFLGAEIGADRVYNKITKMMSDVAKGELKMVMDKT